MQSLQGVFAVLLLGAEALRLDDDDALLADAPVAEVQQAMFIEGGQGGGADIEAQVDGGGDFVDVLPAGALGADRGDFDLVMGDV